MGNIAKPTTTTTTTSDGNANDPDAIHSNVASEISGIAEKASPVNADLVIIEDSEDSNSKKKVQITNLPSGGGGDTDAIHDNVASEISAVTEKLSPGGTDLILIEDAADSNNKKRVQIGNLPISSDTDAIHDNVASEISAVSEKVSPVSADLLLIEDSADSNNKKKIQVGNLPTGSDADAIHDNVASEISAVTEKASPVSADLLLIEDSADSNNKKRVQIGNLPTGSDTDAIHDNVASEISAITSKGSPTSSDLLLIEDVADSNNKKSVTIGSLPTGSDADAIHDNVASEISAVTEKASPTSTDLILIEDAADSNNKKRVQIGNLPTTTGALPLGVDDPADGSSTSASQLLAADSLTGEGATHSVSGTGAIALSIDTTNKAEGTGSIKISDFDAGDGRTNVYTCEFDTSQEIGRYLSFQFRVQQVSSALMPWAIRFWASSNATPTLANAHTVLYMTNSMSFEQFREMTMPLKEKDVTGWGFAWSTRAKNTTGTHRFNLWVDAIGIGASTEIDDRLVRGTNDSVSMRGPQSTITGTSLHWMFPGDNIFDFELENQPVRFYNKYGKFAGGFYPDPTMTTDHQRYFGIAMENLAIDGGMMLLPRNATYLGNEEALFLRLPAAVKSFKIKGENSAFVSTLENRDRTDSQSGGNDSSAWVAWGGERADNHGLTAMFDNIDIEGVQCWQLREETTNGSSLEKLVGSPTDSGTDVELNDLNEEVGTDLRILARGRAGARSASAGTGSDALDTDGQYFFKFNAFDTTQQTDDLEVNVIDGLGVTLATKTFTLTGTTEEYSIAALPAETGTGSSVFAPVKVTFKKATANGNVITIEDATEHGATGFVTAEEGEAAFRGLASGQNVKKFTLRGCHAEGIAGDLWQAGSSYDQIFIAENTVRCNGRQGLATAHARHGTIRDNWFIGVERSCIDVEPDSLGTDVISQFGLTIENNHAIGRIGGSNSFLAINVPDSDPHSGERVGSVNDDITSDLTSSSSDVTLFAVDDDEFIIGHPDPFRGYTLSLDTVSSDDLELDYYYSNGSGGWIQFTPDKDNTVGWTVASDAWWFPSTTPEWEADTSVTGDEHYMIRMVRRANTVTTPPVENQIDVKLTRSKAIMMRGNQINGSISTVAGMMNQSIIEGNIHTAHEYEGIASHGGGVISLREGSHDVILANNIVPAIVISEANDIHMNDNLITSRSSGSSASSSNGIIRITDSENIWDINNQAGGQGPKGQGSSNIYRTTRQIDNVKNYVRQNAQGPIWRNAPSTLNYPLTSKVYSLEGVEMEGGIKNLRGISAGTAPGNQFALDRIALGSGVSEYVLDLTAAGFQKGDVTNLAFTGGNDLSAVAGGDLADDTYYYRVAAWNGFGHPVAEAEQSVVTSGSNNTVRISLGGKLPATAAEDERFLGIVVWRTTVSGDYTDASTRMFIIEPDDFDEWSNRGDSIALEDTGTGGITSTSWLDGTLGMGWNSADGVVGVATTDDRFTAPGVDTTGAMRDKDFAVIVTPVSPTGNWNPGYSIDPDTQTVTGCTIDFDAATPDANQLLDITLIQRGAR